MTILLFLWHHWLIVSAVVGIAAVCALEPSLALIFARGYWKTILAGALVGLFAMFWGWSNYRAGVHEGDKALAAMTALRDGARTALQADAVAFRKLQAMEAANAEQARLQVIKGDQALQTAEVGRSDATGALHAWQDRYRVLLASKQLKGTDCAVPTDY